jgi:hypothetical protein
MYNIPLVLLIGQNSQMDPREYLPFLRELSSLESNYQRFCIDKRLKRYGPALRHIRLAGLSLTRPFYGCHITCSGNAHFQEAITFINDNTLYADALEVWADDHDEKLVGSPLPFFGPSLRPDRNCWACMGIGSSNGGSLKMQHLVCSREPEYAIVQRAFSILSSFQMA